MNHGRWHAEKVDDEGKLQANIRPRRTNTVSLCFSYICWCCRDDRTASFMLLLLHEYTQQGVLTSLNHFRPCAVPPTENLCSVNPLSHQLPCFLRVWNSACSVFLPFLPLPHHTYKTCTVVWRYYLTKHTSPSLHFHSCFNNCVAFLIIAWCLLPGESELST